MGSATAPKTSEIYEPVANRFIVKGVVVSVQSAWYVVPCPEGFTTVHMNRAQRENRFSFAITNLLFFLAWNSCTLFARFRQADGDRLLPALHGASLTALARFQRAPLLAPHRAGYGF